MNTNRMISVGSSLSFPVWHELCRRQGRSLETTCHWSVEIIKFRPEVVLEVHLDIGKHRTIMATVEMCDLANVKKYVTVLVISKKITTKKRQYFQKAFDGLGSHVDCYCLYRLIPNIHDTEYPF